MEQTYFECVDVLIRSPNNFVFRVFTLCGYSFGSFVVVLCFCKIEMKQEINNELKIDKGKNRLQ